MPNKPNKPKKKSAAPRRELPLLDGNLHQRIMGMYASGARAAIRMDILRALDLREGEQVLEIGPGPGFLAREIATAVGPAGRVLGVEINPDMLAESRALCADYPWCEFREGDAAALPVADGEFDAVSAASMLQYVADMDRALAEIHRVLRPLGRVVIFDTEWDSVAWYSRNRKRMKRVLAAWRNSLASPNLFQTLAPKLKRAGFVLQRRDMLATFNPEPHPNTESHEGMGLIAGVVAGKHGVSKAEAQAWEDEQRQLAKAGEFFFAVSRFLFTALKPGPAP